MPTLDADVRHHLHGVLGVPTSGVRPWLRQNELPYFLKDAFHFRELDLLGHPVVLAIARHADKQPLGEVRNQLDRVRAIAGHPVVYVTRALASYERRRLIEQKVPFIVPGNQLYLPDLGIDLREYFRQPTPASEAFSPSAQAILIIALLRPLQIHQPPWQEEWRPSAVASGLGYTPMTFSRAVKELTAAGLVVPSMDGRSLMVQMAHPPKQTWEQARPKLRSPIKRSVWVKPPIDDEHELRAGVSALARHSMLVYPKIRQYAVSPAAWKSAKDAGLQELPEPVSGACQWQLWSYSPEPLSLYSPLRRDMPDRDPHTVDPLSLALSLQDDMDERVQQALDELLGQLSW